MKDILLSTLLMIGLSGCATTQSSRGDLDTRANDVLNLASGFTPLEKGGSFHKTSGLVCPAKLNGLDYTGNHSLAIDGSNVSCAYSAEGHSLTLYLLKSEGDTLRGHLLGSTLAASMIGAQQGYKYDKEGSFQCTLSGLLTAASQKAEDVFSFEASVLKSPQSLSVIALHSISDSFMKIRYTRKFSGAPGQDDLIKMCTDMGRTMITSSGNVSDNPVKCGPTYSSIYQPPLKLGGAGRTIQVPKGESCSLK